MEIANLKKKASVLGVAVSTLLMLMKIIVGLAVNSIAIVSEGLNSLTDLISVGFGYWSIRRSSQAPDETHPYGHGKYESLAGFLQAIIIISTGVGIMYKGIHELTHGAKELKIVPVGMGVMAFSALASFIMGRYILKIAKQTESAVLRADAMHFSMDVYSNLGVFAALILATITGKNIFDPIMAIIVAGIILFPAYGLIKASVQELVDAQISPDIIKIINEIMMRHFPDVINCHKIRSRRSGSFKQIDLHVVTCRKKNVDEAHALVSHLEEDVKQELANTDVLIHCEPCKEECDDFPRCTREKQAKNKIR